MNDDYDEQEATEPIKDPTPGLTEEIDLLIPAPQAREESSPYSRDNLTDVVASDTELLLRGKQIAQSLSIPPPPPPQDPGERKFFPGAIGATMLFLLSAGIGVPAYLIQDNGVSSFDEEVILAKAKTAPVKEEQFLPPAQTKKRLLPPSSTKVAAGTTYLSEVPELIPPQATRFHKASFSPQKVEPKAPESQPEPIAHKPPALDPSKWFVQIAAFETSEEAQALDELLTVNGFPAVAVDVEIRKKVYHRVLVGPYDDRSSAASSVNPLKALPYTKSDLFIRQGPR